MGSWAFQGKNVLCPLIQTLSLVIFRVSFFEEGLLQRFVALEAIEDEYQDYDEAIKEKLFPPGWKNEIRLGRERHNIRICNRV